MSDFKEFKDLVLSLPGVWQESKNVYFSQMRDGYLAAYKPSYPEGTKKDMTLQTIYNTGAYLRGAFELSVFLENKFTAIYFSDVGALIKYFAEA